MAIRQRARRWFALGSVVVALPLAGLHMGPAAPAGAATLPPAGAVPHGTATYPLPADAVVVAPNGDDTNAGSLAAPLRTLGRAIAVARPGAAVSLRAGIYREAVTLNGKPLTIQNHPGEAVTVRGALVVKGWTAQTVGTATVWRKGNWNYALTRQHSE